MIKMKYKKLKFQLNFTNKLNTEIINYIEMLPLIKNTNKNMHTFAYIEYLKTRRVDASIGI